EQGSADEAAMGSGAGARLGDPVPRAPDDLGTAAAPADHGCAASEAEGSVSPGALRALARRAPDGPPRPLRKGVDCLRHRGRRLARHHRVHCEEDRKSTRLNSSHVKISYAVFCLKKKTT